MRYLASRGMARKAPRSLPMLSSFSSLISSSAAFTPSSGEREKLLQNSTESSSGYVSSSMASARPSSVRRTSP